LLYAALLWLLGGRVTGAAAQQPYAPTYTGRIVQFALSGHEPDFDPIYRLILEATLHDPRRAPAALPDATLLLSSFMESFTPSTTPILPDLLRPDQPATGLRAFLQGKAALVNAGGRVAYRGSLLAEIFRDNAVHLVLTLQRPGAPDVAAPLRLQGIFMLTPGTQRGSLRALGPLERSALQVPRGPIPSWRTLAQQLVVLRPAMVGQAGAASPSLAAGAYRAPAAMTSARRANAPTRGVGEQISGAQRPAQPAPVTRDRPGSQRASVVYTAGHGAGLLGTLTPLGIALAMALLLGGGLAAWRLRLRSRGESSVFQEGMRW
jgi:hypothetical protein